MPSKFIILSLVTGVFLLSGCGNKETKEQTDKVSDSKKIVVTEDAVKALKKETKSKENSGQFYYSYNKEKEGDDYNSEASKTRTELDAYRDIKSPYERVQITLMIQQLSPDYRLLCSACHDDYANGVVGPALLDKNATFIFDQILAFKSGQKKNPLMKQLVNRIDEKRLKAIAKEIERFNKEIKEMRSKR
jgi:cytochrome c553/outer membrane murein-binding lipoprotein Lpp